MMQDIEIGGTSTAGTPSSVGKRLIRSRVPIVHTNHATNGGGTNYSVSSVTGNNGNNVTSNTGNGGSHRTSTAAAAAAAVASTMSTTTTTTFAPTTMHPKRIKQQRQRRQQQQQYSNRRNASWWRFGAILGGTKKYDATTKVILTLLFCIVSIMLIVFAIVLGYILSHDDSNNNIPVSGRQHSLLQTLRHQPLLASHSVTNSKDRNEQLERFIHLQQKVKREQQQLVLQQPALTLGHDKSNDVNLAPMQDFIPQPHKPVYKLGNITAKEMVAPSFNRATDEEVIDMRILNYEFQYKNVDGGVWKQGFDIHVDPITKMESVQVTPPMDTIRRENEMQQQKQNENSTNYDDNDKMLQIFVVPHSHCDPGWIQTFDSYFRHQTSNIITTVITALLKDPRRTFIWAEISYFSWWYEIQDSTMKQNVRTLLDNGQLEFVTGGWVQPDEANSELYAMEIQLQEGHDWIANNLGRQYIPQYGWAIDPFGYSPTAAYLWKKYNFTAIVIQRVHYEMKKELASRKHLEFFWRQTWDTNPSNTIIDPINHQPVQPYDLFTHVMPFYSYDVPHTCGPDPSVCCQFDFARLGHIQLKNGQNQIHSITCPWRPQSQIITEENVKERAELLLDQYRKKATLYRSNAVLIPVGDDFRYQSTEEAESQYTNYQLLFDYINANIPNVHVQFSTLSEYFRTARRTFHGPIPILKGSFFTYSDRENDYWSGYFTSRAFDKALDRQLERVLYVAESLGGTRTELQAPRRALSLFQHHDGVAGTAKPQVVEDYARRMYDAIDKAFNWILRTNSRKIQSLLSPLTAVSIEEIQPCWTSSAPRDIQQNLCIDNISSEDKTGVVVYNPLDRHTQYCGDTAIPGKEWAYVTIPCDTPGPVQGQSTVLPTFNSTTGLMLTPIKEEWKVWNVKEGGAYLFFPHHMTSYDLLKNDLIIENGGYIVRTKYWNRTVVIRKDRTVELSIDFIYETNLVADNQEWLARFSSSTPIESDGYFYTDLNGFNFDTHRFRSDMPVQSQVFPMPTLASVQDEKFRLTVLSEHSQGSCSIENSSIDVWLDRRLGQDDNRGLGEGVKDNRPTRTRFRVVLETQQQEFQSSNKVDYNITPFVRQMWDELQHPLVMFGKHVKPSESERKLEQISIKTLDSTVTNEDVPFVIMSYKRLDYLKSAIKSIMASDFPREHVPLVISHDGHVSEMIEYVQSLKDDFPKLVQVIHPYSCYDHPQTFPGNDPSLNVNYTGDAYGHPRSWGATCCKHHFTWLMSSIFTQQSDLKSYNTFLFTEEDYVVGPKIYQAITNGLRAMKENDGSADGGFFGLVLDPTIKGSAPTSTADVWQKSAFISGPMTMNRNVFDKIRLHASTYCGLDGFDEYNWDWTFVHMQSIGQIPWLVLIPSFHLPLARHIGINGGLHSHKGESQVSDIIVESFTGKEADMSSHVVAPSIRKQGWGGWGHPLDHQHCMNVLMETNITEATR